MAVSAALPLTTASRRLAQNGVVRAPLLRYRDATLETKHLDPC